MSFRLIVFLLLVLYCLVGCSEDLDKPQAGSEGSDQTLASLVEKKVLYINSYHKGYEWSDAITSAILKYFKIPDSDIEPGSEAVGEVRLKIVYMDSKRRKGEEYLQKKGLEIKNLIEDWQPDVVITSDDNAAKYVIAPYFLNHSIPFVFCGINWDASEYGLPAANITGMLEVQLIDEIVLNLIKLSKGSRIAFLKGDDRSARKEALFYEERFSLTLDKRFVNNFGEWQNEYLALQQEADMLLLGNSASVSGWDSNEAKKIIAEYSRIPSGNWDIWMAPYALLTFATKPEEQGQWAAKTAKEILAGRDPGSISVVQNKVAHVMLNMALARKLDLKLPVELVEQAVFVEN